MRNVMYGYRYGEVPLDKVGPIKDGTKIKVRTMRPYTHRRPMAVGFGNAIGAAPPHVDSGCVQTAVAGAQKRYASKPPAPAPELLVEFKQFVADWCAENLVPLEFASDVSVETWLASCNYTTARKNDLLEAYRRINHINDPSKKYFVCKSFIKDETYQSYKHARTINSRSDEFKATVGPIFRLIEKVVFKHEAFIKKIPIADRPKYIFDLLHIEGAQYFAADYTAFESLFTKDLMESCEMVMYEYMVKHIPEGGSWLDLVRTALTGDNVCQYKDFTVQVPCTRMSGEMNTSLGNGFTNLMALLFLAKKNGCTNIKVVVEGDDSAARMTGPRPTVENFASLGLNCKVEFHDSIEQMSFCGLVFDREDKRNVTDPRDVMVNFGWFNSLYVRSSDTVLKKLLRCKSLSLAHQYPGCPIISALADYGLRVTRSIDVRHFITEKGRFSEWERNQLIDALRDEKKIVRVAPGMNTRLLVEKLYGVTVEQQLAIEAYFDSLSSVTCFDMTQMICNTPPSWEDFYWNYVRNVDVFAHVESDNPAGFVGSIAQYMNNINPIQTREDLDDSRLRR